MEGNSIQKVLVHLPALAACLTCASADRTRGYLIGVYIDCKDGETRYVGTDGHRLCLAQPSPQSVRNASKVFNFTPNGHDGVILAAEDARELLRWRKDSVFPAEHFAMLEIEGKRLRFTSHDGRYTLNCKSFDATYPDYSRAMGRDDAEYQAGAVGFNAQYLRVLLDVAKAGFAHAKSAAVTAHLFGPSSPAKFTMESPEGHKATVVIMPMRV